MYWTRILVALVGSALLATLGAGTSATPAAAAQTSKPIATAPVPIRGAMVLTPREKRLSKAKSCTKRQWRKTPVRCKRIRAAKAKARAIKAAAQPRPTTPLPTSPVPTELAPFTLAVVPDTQQETHGSDQRMRQRSDWLVQQRAQLNLRFVDHIGDVVNWGWLDPRQYAVAAAGLRPLELAGIPYSLSVGNHDTRAVGWDGRGAYGGAAYVDNPECVRRLGAAQCKSHLLVRRTDEFNAAFSAQRFGAVRGVFEPGKVDNSYSTFRAGGRDWMVLSIELWPRAAAVEWARGVVAAHPQHNVVVSTHSYLSGDGGNISTSAGGYGATSPRYLYDRLVSQYPNVKLVLSGHVGTATARYDVGRAGNKIVSLLQAFHSRQGNPVRLVRIDPRSGALETWVTSPNGRGGDFSKYRTTIRGLDFVG